MGRCRIISVALGLLVLLAFSFLLDASVASWVEACKTPDGIAVGRTISRFGAWPWLMLAMLCAAVLAYFLKQPAALRIIIAMMLTASAAGLFADAAKSLTGRTRPNSSLASGWYGPRHFGDTRYASFPSGHAATSAALIGPLIVLRRRLGLMMLVVPLTIAAARIYINAHHFSDTVAGACVGVLITWLWWLIAARKHSALVPSRE